MIGKFREGTGSYPAQDLLIIKNGLTLTSLSLVQQSAQTLVESCKEVMYGVDHENSVMRERYTEFYTIN